MGQSQGASDETMIWNKPTDINETQSYLYHHPLAGLRKDQAHLQGAAVEMADANLFSNRILRRSSKLLSISDT